MVVSRGALRQTHGTLCVRSGPCFIAAQAVSRSGARARGAAGGTSRACAGGGVLEHVARAVVHTRGVEQEGGIAGQTMTGAPAITRGTAGITLNTRSCSCITIQSVLASRHACTARGQIRAKARAAIRGISTTACRTTGVTLYTCS